MKPKNLTSGLNRVIKEYQQKLTYQLELKAEAELGNGNVGTYKASYYESNIVKCEKIIASLATIKRALEKNRKSVKIAKNDEYRREITDAMYVADFGDFSILSNNDGELELHFK